MSPSPDARAARTRRAILEAAAQLLSKDAGASLAAVAAAAGLGRATLHRYFPTRDELLQTLALDAVDRLSAAITACRPEQGPVPEVLRRIAEAVLPMASEFRFLELGPGLWDLPELSARWYALTGLLEDVVERGKAEGHVRPGLPTAWVADLFSAALWTAGESVADGRVARRDAPRLAVEVVLHGITPTDRGAP